VSDLQGDVDDEGPLGVRGVGKSVPSLGGPLAGPAATRAPSRSFPGAGGSGLAANTGAGGSSCSGPAPVLGSSAGVPAEKPTSRGLKQVVKGCQYARSSLVLQAAKPVVGGTGRPSVSGAEPASAISLAKGYLHQNARKNNNKTEQQQDHHQQTIEDKKDEPILRAHSQKSVPPKPGGANKQAFSGTVLSKPTTATSSSTTRQADANGTTSSASSKDKSTTQITADQYASNAQKSERRAKMQQALQSHRNLLKHMQAGISACTNKAVVDETTRPFPERKIYFCIQFGNNSALIRQLLRPIKCFVSSLGDPQNRFGKVSYEDRTCIVSAKDVFQLHPVNMTGVEFLWTQYKCRKYFDAMLTQTGCYVSKNCEETCEVSSFPRSRTARKESLAGATGLTSSTTTAKAGDAGTSSRRISSASPSKSTKKGTRSPVKTKSKEEKKTPRGTEDGTKSASSEQQKTEFCAGEVPKKTEMQELELEATGSSSSASSKASREKAREVGAAATPGGPIPGTPSTGTPSSRATSVAAASGVGGSRSSRGWSSGGTAAAAAATTTGGVAKMESAGGATSAASSSGYCF
ncbi:unnamed protein product, partial [Amoebophrya sp. A25]